MLRSSLLALALSFLCPIFGFSQNIPSANDADLLLQSATPIVIPDSIADTLTNPLYVLGPTDSLDYVLMFQCPDTLNIDSIHAKVGSTTGGNQLGEFIFLWDDYSPSSGTYSRRGNTVYLGVGRHVLFNPTYCEVYFTNTSGHSSSLTTFNTGN